MTVRTIIALVLTGGALAACTTGSGLPPTEVLRYHLGGPIDRGTIAVEPLTGNGPASIEYKNYAAAVEGELLKIGYLVPPPGTTPLYVATVAFTRTTEQGAPRESPVSIGIGGGSFSGGRRGGVGLGGGIGFPIGHARPREILVSELAVTIRRRADQSPVWEGRAHTAALLRGADADTDVQAGKLARALFTGFPGESGRTIEVR